VEPGDDKLKEKIRTKGIPHPSGPFYYQESILSDMDAKVKSDNPTEYCGDKQEKLNEIAQWIEDPQAYTIPKNLIGKRLYLYESEFESMLTTRINFELIRQMMAKQGTLCCYIGTMKKAFLDANGKALMIKPTVVKRLACVTDWWHKEGASRFFKKGEEGLFDLSYPQGHVIFEEVMQSIYNDLLQEEFVL